MLEVNPRASRTVPFVAKTIGKPIAAIAAKMMAGHKLSEFDLSENPYDHIAVKEAVFPFARFPGVDTGAGSRNALHRRGHGSGLATARARIWAQPSPAPSPKASSAAA